MARSSLLPWLLGSALGGGLVACSTSTTVEVAPPTPPVEDGGVSEPPGADASSSSPVDLTIDRDEAGLPTRLFAHATMDGRDVALLVDTGSQLTFLCNPEGRDGEPDVGTVVLGGETRSLLGRPIELTGSDTKAGDRPVVGFLGVDWFVEGPLREIDPEARQIRVVDHVPPGWTSLRYENRKGYLFVDVEIDEAPLTLGFDTGAAHTLWLGQEGRPGDTEVRSNDAYGAPIILFLGTGSLTIAGEATRSIPVLRTTSFPSFEASNALVGGKIDGLFGLSAFATGKVIVDPARETIWLEE